MFYHKFFTILTLVRRYLYITFGYIDLNILHRSNLITILSYHSIEDDKWRFSIDPEMLRKQITYLDAHYDFISLKDLEEYLKNKKFITKPSIVLTFDDGYRDILEVKNLFDELNVKPALFILADPERADHEQLQNEKKLLSKNEILILINEGWEIGSHSMTHPDLSRMSKKELENEICLSKQKLEKDLNIPIRYFAYPRGKYSKKVLDLVEKSKYSLGLTMDDGIIDIKTNPLLVPRIGIDRTHSFREFKYTFSTSNIKLRQIIKNTFLKKYL